jgi:hypothetical protein
MTDHLAGLPPERVAAWYRRLAARIARERVEGQEPLASQLLGHWLDNRDPGSTFQIVAPAYLRISSHVERQQDYHRAVFLTEERARFAAGRRDWACIVPRLQGSHGYTRWNLEQPLELEYESLVEVGSGPLDILRIQQTGTPAERDLLTALRGFQLRSRARANGSRQRDGRVRITLSDWRGRVRDRYDWDYTEHFTVPNPDQGSTLPDAVRPADATLTVYHSNAQRLERAGLAAPYDLVSDEWPVSRASLTAAAEVDPSRRL